MNLNLPRIFKALFNLLPHPFNIKSDPQRKQFFPVIISNRFSDSITGLY